MKMQPETHVLPIRALMTARTGLNPLYHKQFVNRMATLLTCLLGLTGAPSLVMAQACASSQGPVAPPAAGFSTAALAGSSFSWSNVSGAQSLDASYASAGISLGVLSSAYSNYLVAQNFGFSIPSTATICEIVVSVTRSATGTGLFGAVTDQSVRLLKAGVLTGSNQANTATPWPSSDAIATYGNSVATGLWSAAWLPSDLNDPNFGVAVSTALNTGVVSLFMTAQINRLQVTVYYDNAVLGIPLEHFSVTKEVAANRLDWTVSSTITETKTPASVDLSFHVQRSADARSWQELATTPAGDELDYSYTDAAPLTGPNFYRIRWQTAAGQSVYSTIAEVIWKYQSIHCYPNPFVNTITVSSANPVYNVVLQDAQGKTLQVKNYSQPGSGGGMASGTGNPSAGTGSSGAAGSGYTLQLATPGLSPGLYFIRVNGSVFKLIKR